MKAEPILRNSIYTGLALLLLVPMIVTDFMYFPYITGKNFVFRAIVLIIFGLWVALALQNKKYSPRRSGLLWAFGGWVLLMFFANAFGENPLKAFWSNFERMEGWVTLLALFLLFVVMTSVMRSKKVWMRFFHASLCVSSFIGIASIVDFLKSGARADVYLGNAAYLAGYLLLHVFIALWLFWRWYREEEKSRFYTQGRSWIYIGALLLNLLGLYYTQTRGAILGFLAGLGLATLIIALFEKERRRVRKSAIGALVLVLVIVGGFLVIQNTSFVQNNSTLRRFADISLEENTTKTRLIVWGSALEGFSERPILGWGQEGFNYVYNKYYDPEMYDAEPWYDRTHNILFDWLIAGGILGILGYLSLYFFALFFIWKDERMDITEKSIFTGLLGAYFVHNLFVFDNITSYLLFTFLLSYFHVQHTQDGEEPRGRLIQSDAIRRVAQTGVVVACLVLAYMVNVPSLSRADTLLDALRELQQARQVQDNVPEMLEAFEHALDIPAPVGAQEVREQFSHAAHYVSVMGTVDGQIKALFAGKAAEALEAQLEQTPNDARILVFLGSLYNQYGQYERALDFLNRALDASPQKQTILLQINRSYIQLGEYQKALEITAQLYETTPYAVDIAVAHASNLIHAGRTAEAEALLEDFVEMYPNTEDAIESHADLIQAYAETNQFGKAIPLLEKRVEKQPTNIQAWTSLAALQYQAGQVNTAIQTLQEAGQRFPQAKSQLDAFIADIRAGELTY